MLLRISICALCCAVAFSATHGLAQDDTKSLRDELNESKKRLSELEQKAADDRKKIDNLEQRLEKQEDAGQAGADDPAPGSDGIGFGSGDQSNLFNPAITAFGDMGAGISSNGDNDAVNRFNLREVEVDFRAAIAPTVDGVLILAIGEELEDEDGDLEVHTHFGVEEGFVNFHTLPFDLAIKAGRFRTAFGQSNLLHTHDLPQITRPLAAVAFLGHEGLISNGGSVNWIVPDTGDLYIEVTAQVVNADGGEESPILGGPNAENPAALGHIKLFKELNADTWLEVGGSYLWGHTDADSDFDANVFGLDITFKWIDPNNPDAHSLIWQTEFFWGANDVPADGGSPEFRNHSFGAYSFVQCQLARDWYAGGRFDWTEFPLSEDRGPDDRDWAVSAYVSYYLTEFLRLRFEVQHREFRVGGDWEDEQNYMFGLTFAIGAHPSHPYWVNR